MLALSYGERRNMNDIYQMVDYESGDTHYFCSTNCAESYREANEAGSDFGMVKKASVADTEELRSEVIKCENFNCRVKL